jgi:hypothetical protein
MPAHSYFPGQSAPTLFAMAGDDCSLHFDLHKLTPKQRTDHEANLNLTATLQVALLFIGYPKDQAALFDAFLEEPWAAALNRYHDAFRKMGGNPVPLENCHHHPKRDFYASVAQQPGRPDLTTLYMVSGSNAPLHKSESDFKISQAVNSKFHFAEHAPRFGLPTPDTFVCAKHALEDAPAAAFMAKHENQIILKTLGLAGARNVTPVASIAECQEYVAEYADDMAVLLQERLQLDEWTEMTADLRVTPAAIEIGNVRRIMFADGVWVGNLIGPSVTIPEKQSQELIRVGEYARAQGYCAPEGVNCGVDFFVRDEEMLVTEINARWTGGLFPAEFINQLNLHDQDVIPFMDVIPASRLNDLIDFFEPRLPGKSTETYAFAPLGFCPYPQDMHGEEMVYTWQMVAGDFEAFKTDKNKILDSAALPAADRISLSVG